MTGRLPELIDAFAGRRVLVVGDPILDGYLEGACCRVCPEAPAPVVDVRGEAAAPAGPGTSRPTPGRWGPASTSWRSPGTTRRRTS